MPAATRNPDGNCSPGCPTGNVSNGNASYFGGRPFILDTEDGILANWTGASTAVVAFGNSASGAVYDGLALLNSSERRLHGNPWAYPLKTRASSARH
jgi:hypothetical protein